MFDKIIVRLINTMISLPFKPLCPPPLFLFAFKKRVIQKICSKTQTQFLLIVVSKVSVTFNFCAVVTLAF